MKVLVVDKTISEISFIRNKYHNDIRSFKQLTPEEEFECFDRYKKGDVSAKETIILANLRFVISCAKRYENCGVPLEDLINEGNIGLITAVDRFDHTKGFKFISYAVGWIKQAILVSISEDSRTIYLPANVTSKLTRLKDEINRIESKLGYVDMDEVLSNVNMTKDVVMINESIQTVSTEKTYDEDSEITLGDTLVSNDTYDNTIDSEYIINLLGILNKDESDIVKRVCGFPPFLMTEPIESIADSYKSKSYVTTTYNKAIKKLRLAMLNNSY
jgi:RNA polymerase primary sigma factor